MEDNREKNEIFSKRVKAGKRTYFFDVKATKSDDYYLTITESKRVHRGEEVSFEKHKIFLYKEDFSKIVGALEDTINHIKSDLILDENLEDLSNDEVEDAPDDSMKW